MMKFLKTRSFQIFRFLLILVLAGKISNWFLNYSDQTNQLLNTAMFSLIGLAYLAFSWAYDQILWRSIFLFCGVYVILMNFIPDFGWVKSIIGIICIITPFIIGRFLPDEGQEITEK